MVGMVGFCGSRALPSSTEVSVLVDGVVGSVLSGGRDVAVGCAIGGDALVLSSALAAGASSRLRVFAAFGPVSSPWPSTRVSALGASSSLSSVSGVASAFAAGASVRWWAGGGPAIPLAGRLASRSAALVSAVAASGAGRDFVGLVSSPCPTGLGPSASPSVCFSGSGSWASLALASGLGLPVVVFPLLPSSCDLGTVLPAFWLGSWVAGPAWHEHGYLFPTRVGTPERGDNVLKRSLKPLAAQIGDPTLDFRKLRRSHSTFYAVLNVHPRVAQMSMGHGSFDTTMKYYTGVPADLQKRAAEALGELLFGPQNAPAGGHTPATPPSNPEDLAMLKAELQQKLLQIEELEARARQDPDIRSSDP